MTDELELCDSVHLPQEARKSFYSARLGICMIKMDRNQSSGSNKETESIQQSKTMPESKQRDTFP